MITVTQNDINASVPSKHKICNKTTVTRFSMYITVVNGKVCNFATGNSFTIRCYIYKLIIKCFNNLDNVLKHEVCQSASSETEKSEWSQDEDEL